MTSDSIFLEKARICHATGDAVKLQANTRYIYETNYQAPCSSSKVFSGVLYNAGTVADR
jgi:hypothetical protein